MSHRNELNELTKSVSDLDTWQTAVTELHKALQIAGIVLDDLEQRVAAIEMAQREAS